MTYIHIVIFSISDTNRTYNFYPSEKMQLLFVMHNSTCLIREIGD
jgi:hypothetical protein